MNLPLAEKPALADAAHVLSDQLRAQLRQFARHAARGVDSADRKFAAALRRDKVDAGALAAAVSITFGAAARLLSSGKNESAFFEQVSRSGRLLAKMNVPPDEVLRWLERYDELLAPLFEKLSADEQANARWVRDQLHFCVVLSLNNAYYQVREAETQAFQQVMSVELESAEPAQVYQRFIEVMAASSHAAAARLYIVDGNRARLEAATPAEPAGATVDLKPALLARLSATVHRASERQAPIIVGSGWEQYRCTWSMPLKRDGVLAGFAQFAFRQHREWLPRELELFSATSERCVMVADRARLIRDLAERETQLKKLAEHMLLVEEMERRRISRELHDDAGQSLVCIRLQMEMAEMDLPPEMGEVREKLKEARDLTEKTILDIRRLISDLSPAVLEQLGLGAAVRQLINRFRKSYPCAVRLYVGRFTEVPQRVQIVTYRLLQECCNNIARHSAATNVNISVTAADGVLKLNVRDNGVGFQVDEAFTKHRSFGLAGMRERVALLGGTFTVRSNPRSAGRRNQGTEIGIHLPLSSEKNL